MQTKFDNAYLIDPEFDALTIAPIALVGRPA